MTQELNADLVLEGGGVKGIGLLGAVLQLSEAGYRFPRIAGTSAGAIVAALVAAYQRADMDLHGLIDVMNTVKYSKFPDAGPLERATGRIGEGISTLLRGFAHTGSYLEEWLGPELEKANVKTFRDLALDDPGGTLKPYQSYKLVVHTTDITRNVLVRLPWDCSQYELVADDYRVVDAVHASMAIPFFFRPFQLPTSHGTVTWVDGGLVAGFPITVFDRTDGEHPRWPTIGVRLSGEPGSPTKDRPVRTAFGLAANCLTTLTSEWNRYHLEEEGVNQRTIYVDTNHVNAIDFDIDRPTQNMLFENGRAAARKFLALPPRPPAIPADRTATA